MGGPSEADLADIGKAIGVSKQATRHKEGWQKLAPLPRVNRKAHIAADQASEALAEPPTEAGTDKSADAPQATEFDGSASEALAVTLRSGVLERHRQEWADLETEARKALLKLATAHE